MDMSNLLGQGAMLERRLPERVVPGQRLLPAAHGVASALLADAWLQGRNLNFLKIAIGLSQPAAGLAVDPHIMAQYHERLRGMLRSADALTYLGEGRYLALLPGLRGITDAALAAGRIVEAFSAPAPAQAAEAPVYVNIGIARYPEDASQLTTLLEHAELALDLSREAGVNCFSFAECSLNDTLDCASLSSNPSLQTGLETVDEPHRVLFARLIAIAGQLRAQAGLSLLQDSLAQFLGALREHFVNEERELEQIAAPGAGEHRAEHAMALQSVRWLANAEPRQAVGLVARYCFDWFEQHARSFDRELAQYQQLLGR